MLNLGVCVCVYLYLCVCSLHISAVKCECSRQMMAELELRVRESADSTAESGLNTAHISPGTADPDSFTPAFSWKIKLTDISAMIADKTPRSARTRRARWL